MSRKSDKQKLIDQYAKNNEVVEVLSRQLVEMQETIDEQAKVINGYKAYANIRGIKGKETREKKIKSKYFFKGYTMELMKLITSKILTNAQQRILFCTTPFLEKETNFILNKDGQRANKNDILDIVDMDKKTFDSALEGLSDMGIMFKVTTGKRNISFVINSKYFYIGEDNEIWAETETIRELLNPNKCAK